MARPSSTSSSRSSSSSRGLAALLALAALVAFDRLALPALVPWEAVWERIDDRWKLERGLARDRVELGLAAEERRAGRTEPLLVVVGTSRANAGFRLPFVSRRDRERLLVARVTHAQVDPFVIRSLVPDLVASDPDVVALLLSEFDTHGHLLLVPPAAYGSAGAIVELVLAAPAFAWENRLPFYRLFAGAFSNAYRYRDVFGRAGLDALRRFDLDSSEADRGPGAATAFAVLAGNPRAFLSDDAFEERFAEALREWPDIGNGRYQVRHIARGPHAEVHMALLESAIARLRDAGIEVLIVEAPLHPASATLYDVSLRDAFLAFVHRLERERGVHFVPLDETGPFVADEFADMTHLDRAGAGHMTRAVLDATYRVLPQDP